jgi:hypothetical protein
MLAISFKRGNGPPRVARARGMQSDDEAWVEVIVGGERFATTLRTLRTRESYLKGIVDSCVAGVVRVDRDPTNFRHVLNHLRGSNTFPHSPDELDALRHEATFYSLDELARAIDYKKQARVRATTQYWLEAVANAISINRR